MLVVSLPGLEVEPHSRKRRLPSRMLLYVASHFRLSSLITLHHYYIIITSSISQDFITQKGYPNWTNVTCVREGAETPLFKQNFSNWLNKDETRSPLQQKVAAGRK